MKLSIVIPCFNEKKTICELIDKVCSVPINKEIIIVDDGSTDGTREFLTTLKEKPDFKIIFQARNQGKGAALATGFKEITGEIVIIQDADLEYDPFEYPKLINPIINGFADVVYGSRFGGGGEHRVLYFWHTIGNKFLTLFSNMMTDLNLTDMETCYKVFKSDVLKEITIESKRFGFEPEITAKVARAGYVIYEVPISYYGRTYAEGKKINWKDGFSAIFTIVRFSRKPLVETKID